MSMINPSVLMVLVLARWSCWVQASDAGSFYPNASNVSTSIASAASPNDSQTGSQSDSQRSGSQATLTALPKDLDIDMFANETQAFVDAVLQHAPMCSDGEQSRLFGAYTNNKAIYTHCVNITRYRLFPNKGVQPTEMQMKKFLGSHDCLTLATGVAKSFFPECTVYNFSGRSASEVLLRIRHDVVIQQRPLPTPDQYAMQYRFNQAVNLLMENAQVRMKMYSNVANEAFPLNKLVKARSPTLLLEGVQVSANFTICMDDPRTLSGQVGRVPSSSGSTAGSVSSHQSNDGFTDGKDEITKTKGSRTVVAASTSSAGQVLAPVVQLCVCLLVLTISTLEL